VTGIRWGAFDGCTSLESVIIPDSVTIIYVSAFFGCVNLKSITVDENNIKYSSSQNGILLDKEGKTVIYCPNKTSELLPITSIGRTVRYGGTTMTSLIWEGGLTSIGAYAYNGSVLESIEIPDSVKSIDYGAFYNCENLESVTFKSETPPEFFNYKVFVNCPNLKTIYVPAGAEAAYGNVANEYTNSAILKGRKITTMGQ